LMIMVLWWVFEEEDMGERKMRWRVLGLESCESKMWEWYNCVIKV
jgi:hypothetical protein